MMKRGYVWMCSGLLLLASCNFDAKKGDKQAKDESTIQVVPEVNHELPAKPKEAKQFMVDRPVQELNPGEAGQGAEIFGLFSEGVNLLKQNKYAEGIAKFSEVIQKDARNSKAYYNRGFGHYYLNEFDNAVSDFNKALELNPKDSTSHLYLGLVHYYRQKYPDAIREYSKALEIYPEYSTAYYNRGIARGRMKDYSGAVRDFDLAIRYKAGYHEAFFNRGLASFYLRDTVRACEDWNKALSLGSAQASQALDLYCKGK